MVCSPAQLISNRRNAARSTGPSEAGKCRSRRNALKHGLTGAGVVVPDEDVAAIEERFEAFEADLKPKGAVAQYHVLRAAMLSVRLERCVRHEAAEITRAMLDAEKAEADARADQVDGLVAWLLVDPAEAVRKLRRTPEGIDWLIGAWRDLSTDLNHEACDRWNNARAERAERLVGRQPGAFGISKVGGSAPRSRRTATCSGPATSSSSPLRRPQEGRPPSSLTAFISAEIDRLEREEGQPRPRGPRPIRHRLDPRPSSMTPRRRSSPGSTRPPPNASSIGPWTGSNSSTLVKTPTSRPTTSTQPIPRPRNRANWVRFFRDD